MTDSPEDLISIAERLARLEGRMDTLEASTHRIEGMFDDVYPALIYPEPIAAPLARERGALLYQTRFSMLLDAGEAFIKYTAAIAIALTIDSTAAGDRLDTWFAEPPTLGTLARYIRESLASLARHSDSFLVAPLYSSLIKRNGKPSEAARYLLDAFIALRNRERGHSSTQKEGVYETLCRGCRPALIDSLAGCSFLKLPLVRVENIDVIGDSQQLSYDLRVLMGHAPVSRLERIASDARVPKGATCVWDRAQGLQPLNGLLSYHTCAACGEDHAFFLEKVEGDVRHYHSYTANHRMQTQTT